MNENDPIGLTPSSNPSDRQVLPAEIRWQPTSAAQAETQEFFFGADTALKVRAPWWLHAEISQGRLKLLPKVCGAFSGKLAVRIRKDWHIATVTSWVAAAPENRWAGAAMALTSALPGSFLAFLFSPLFSVAYLNILFGPLWVAVTPFLVLVPWSARLAGKWFLFRATLAWLVGIGAFLGMTYWLTRLAIPGPPKQLSLRDFYFLCAPGAIAGIFAGWCLSGNLRLPGLAAGVVYPASALFVFHWVTIANLPGLVLSSLLETSLVLPLLLLAPWIGAWVPPLAIRPTMPGKRAVIALTTALGGITVALGYAYQLQKPSALSVARKPLQKPSALSVTREPLNARVSFASASATPGQTLWEFPTKYAPRQIVTSPSSSAVYVVARQIHKIEHDLNSYLEIGTRPVWPVIAGKNDTIYFCSRTVVFAFRNDKKLWSQDGPNVWFDLVTDANENFIAISNYQITSLNASGKPQWSYPEKPAILYFVHGVTDASGNIYIYALRGRVFAIDSQGKLQWERQLQIEYDPFSNPENMCIMNSPTPLLVIGSANGSTAFDAKGDLRFLASQPFKVFGCDENFCYGSDAQGSIYRMDGTGARQLLYTSVDPLIGRLLLGADQRIYALTRAKLTVIKLNGEVEVTFPVSDKLTSLMAVKGNRIYGITQSSALALQGWPDHP